MPLEILKFEELTPFTENGLGNKIPNRYRMKPKRFMYFEGTDKSYDEIIKFFMDNVDEKEGDYDFQVFNLEYLRKHNPYYSP